MKHKNAFILLGASCVLLASAAVWFLGTQSPVPVSASFAGCHPYQNSSQAVAIITNHTQHLIHCCGTMSARSGPAENQMGFNLLILPRTAGRVAVSLPPQTAPGLVRCEIDVVAQHSAWVRWAGHLLDTIGVHIYHVQPRFRSPLTLKFGGGKIRPAPVTPPTTAILPLPNYVSFTPAAATPPLPAAPFPLSSSLTLYSITNQWTLP